MLTRCRYLSSSKPGQRDQTTVVELAQLYRWCCGSRSGSCRGAVAQPKTESHLLLLLLVHDQLHVPHVVLRDQGARRQVLP